MDEIAISEPASPREPVTGDPRGRASRQALLLVLGVLYGNGEYDALLADLGAERDLFDLPDPRPGGAFRLADEMPRLVERHAMLPPFDPFAPRDEAAIAAQAAARQAVMDEMTATLYDSADRRVALDLLLLALGHPGASERAAAAISLLDMVSDPALPIATLAEVVEEDADPLAVRMARTALARLGRLPAPAGQGRSATPPSAPAAAAPDALIVHGTHFARVGTPHSDWWQPSGLFHDYILRNHCPGLYAAPDFFSWSGGWSDHARHAGARHLSAWILARGLSRPDILAHSHGGSVAMHGSSLGLRLNRLVLMSCPVHRGHYAPDPSRIAAVTSYQIHMDFVVLADRGAFRFRLPHVHDRYLGRWFWSHGDSHDPALWQAEGLSL
ncbi:hypothetical protein, partial [Paracoccus sp. (in: a-proteobacteria)]|uniref:hypothetical protein n=1 Tax=Paracoccus sp. TaxID=267 RepID=UPI00405878B8